jgi:hypothetical protein
MAHILLTALILILPSASFACANGKPEQRAAPENYSWRTVIESGKGCFGESGCAPDQWAMAVVPLAAFDKLFIVGWKEVLVFGGRAQLDVAGENARTRYARHRQQH